MRHSGHADDASKWVNVVCQTCGTRMHFGVSHIGRDVRCPDCHTLNRVSAPLSERKRESVLTGNDDDEYRLAPDEPLPDGHRGDHAANPESELIPVHCGICDTLMYARIQDVGKRIQCPDCEGLTVIRPVAPKSAERFQVQDVSDVRVESATPPSVDHQRRETAERLMADAAQHESRRDAERPAPPKAPLREGIYRFPFYPRILAIWVAFGGGLLVNWALYVTLATLIDSGDPLSILCAILAPILAICFFTVLGLAAPVWLTIVEYTADGYDRVPHWPSQDMLSRLYASMLWINAIAMATAPGGLLVMSLQNVWPSIPSAMCLISTVFLLPLTLLSMLVNDSIFAPINVDVFRSLKRCAMSWGWIWLHLLAGMAVIVALYLLAGGLTTSRLLARRDVNQFTVSSTVVCFGVSFYVVLFCRLVGRLAWILRQEDAGQTEQRPTPDEAAAGRRESMGEFEIFSGD